MTTRKRTIETGLTQKAARALQMRLAETLVREGKADQYSIDVTKGVGGWRVELIDKG